MYYVPLGIESGLLFQIPSDIAKVDILSGGSIGYLYNFSIVAIDIFNILASWN